MYITESCNFQSTGETIYMNTYTYRNVLCIDVQCYICSVSFTFVSATEIFIKISSNLVKKNQEHCLSQFANKDLYF